MFYDNFNAACERRGTTMTAVLTELGKASGSIGSWKSGKYPRLDIVMEIAEHLHISLDDLVYGPGKAPYTPEPGKEWVEIIVDIPAERQQLCKDFLRTHMVAKPAKFADSKNA